MLGFTSPYPCLRIVHKSWKWNRSNLSFERFTDDTCIPCNASEFRTRYSFLLRVTRFMAHGVEKIIINFLPLIISARTCREIFDVTSLHGREREREELMDGFVWYIIFAYAGCTTRDKTFSQLFVAKLVCEIVGSVKAQTRAWAHWFVKAARFTFSARLILTLGRWHQYGGARKDCWADSGIG